MKHIVKSLAPALRAEGFSGSGYDYRKTDGGCRLVINFQRSKYGEQFFVNLGAQPDYIPAECNANRDNIKEYECVFRRRVGEGWRMNLSEAQIAALRDQILSSQREFFGAVQQLREALPAVPASELVTRVCRPGLEARTAFHLAEGALALGYRQKARELAEWGLERTGHGAILLRIEFHRIIEQAS